LTGPATDLFLVGLLSALDALVERPLDELLAEVSVPDAIRAALLGAPNELYQALRLVIAYENADWPKVSEQALDLELDEAALADYYLQSCRWVAQILAL
jgi:EAL and modified HD-GYP domain-containing signal transduction protein